LYLKMEKKARGFLFSDIIISWLVMEICQKIKQIICQFKI